MQFIPAVFITAFGVVAACYGIGKLSRSNQEAILTNVGVIVLILIITMPVWLFAIGGR